jgi:PIN domain nuclease of toxin-antitoxin system
LVHFLVHFRVMITVNIHDAITHLPEYLELRQRGYAQLSLSPGAVFMLNRLPDHHQDPFDRMLICQALHHGLTIMTPDPVIRQNPVSVIWD